MADKKDLNKEYADGKKYKIGMAVRESGVSPQTVRFYEKQALIGSIKEDAGTTRYYGVRHLKQLSNIRRYFKLGFSENEVRDLIECRNLEDCGTIYERRIEENRREMERLRINAEILDMHHERIRSIPKMLNRVTVEENPPLWFFINRAGGEMIETEDVEEVQSRWIGNIHMTDIASVIPRDIFIKMPDSQFRLSGHCMEEKYFPMTGGGPGDHVLRYFPKARCLHTVCTLEGEDRSPGVLMPQVYSFLQKHGCQVTGDVFGRMLAILGESGVKTGMLPEAAFYEYWIPIE